VSQAEVAKIIAESNAIVRKSWDDTQKAAAVAAKKHAAAVTAFWDVIDKITIDAGRTIFDWNNEVLAKNKATTGFWVEDWLQAQKDLAALMHDSGRMMADWNDEILAKNKAGVAVWSDEWLKKEKQSELAWKQWGSVAVSALNEASRAAEMSGSRTTAAVMTIGSAALQGFMSGGPLGAVVGGGLAAFGAISGALFKTEGKKVNDLRDAYVAAAGGLSALDIKAHAAGMTLNALLRAGNVRDYEAAINKLNLALSKTAELDALRASSVQTWDTISALAEKYGISLESAGQAVQQLMVTSNAKTAINDWQTWAKAGGDMSALASGMAKNMSALVQQSLAFGTTLPENLRPVLDFLSGAGMLVDAAGNKIDVGALAFGPEVQTEMERMTKAIEDLVAELRVLNGLPAAGGYSRGGGLGRVISEQDTRMGGNGQSLRIQMVTSSGRILADEVVEYLGPALQDRGVR
jgi:hypothetical protein